MAMRRTLYYVRDYCSLTAIKTAIIQKTLHNNKLYIYVYRSERIFKTLFTVTHITIIRRINNIESVHGAYIYFSFVVSFGEYGYVAV